MNIVWLSSYPKSGNTWLRFFLYAYIYGEIKSSADVTRRIPDIHGVSGFDANRDGSVLMKTHWLWSSAHPYRENTAGYIYILRNPRDILLSSLNYCRMEGDDQFTDEEFARQFISNLGVQKWKNLGMGSWVEHMSSWMTGAHLKNIPHILLRYEEMQQDPEKCFTQVVNFLNLKLDEKKLRCAIERCSFGRLSELEQTEKAKNIYSPVFTGSVAGSKDHYFMNKGITGSSLSHITGNMDDEFDQKFGQFLHQWGYMS